MKVLFAESDFWEEHKSLQSSFENVITEAYDHVGKLLPNISKQVTFVVQTSGWESTPETGEGGYTKNSRLILLSLDPGLPFGEKKLLESLRATVFHELNHAARYERNIWHTDFIESCLMEGLATVFEREYAKSDPLWGRYKTAEAKLWLKEIINFKGNYDWGKYMYKHTDGRRWIGYKVGTYLIDEAIKKSGKTVIDLTGYECKEIKSLAGIGNP